MWIMNQKLLKKKTKSNEPKETTKQNTKRKFNFLMHLCGLRRELLGQLDWIYVIKDNMFSQTGM